MANETTTTTLDDLTNTSVVQPVIILALSEKGGFYKQCREFDLTQQATNTAKLPTETSYWGTPNDRGAGVATAFNATEATTLSNTAYSTGNVTCSTAEYGVAHALTDNVAEDSVRGIDVLSLLTGRMLQVLGLAMDDDYIALLAGLSNHVGVTTTALTIAQMIAAQQGLRTRGADADVLTYILDNNQSADVESALVASSTSAATYALSADRLIGYAPSPGNGMQGPMREVMVFRGASVRATGLTDTANAAADCVGAVLCPSSAWNDESGATTFAMAWKRLPRYETQRQARLRETDMVMTARAGFADLQDGTGCSIITGKNA